MNRFRRFVQRSRNRHLLTSEVARHLLIVELINFLSRWIVESPLCSMAYTFQRTLAFDMRCRAHASAVLNFAGKSADPHVWPRQCETNNHECCEEKPSECQRERRRTVSNPPDSVNHSRHNHSSRSSRKNAKGSETPF